MTSSDGGKDFIEETSVSMTPEGEDLGTQEDGVLSIRNRRLERLGLSVEDSDEEKLGNKSLGS